MAGLTGDTQERLLFACPVLETALGLMYGLDYVVNVTQMGRRLPAWFLSAVSGE